MLKRGKVEKRAVERNAYDCWFRLIFTHFVQVSSGLRSDESVAPYGLPVLVSSFPLPNYISIHYIYTFYCPLLPNLWSNGRKENIFQNKVHDMISPTSKVPELSLKMSYFFL